MSGSIFKRILLCVLGIFVMGLGVSLAVKSSLGTSPISSLPYVLSLGVPGISVGTFTFFMNVLFVAIQIVILRKRFKLFQLVQIPLIFGFGVSIDFTTFLISPLIPTSYAVELVLILVSCAVLALGIFILIKANIILMAGDSLIKVISEELGKKFGTVKICFDTTLVLSSVVVSLILMGGVYGVREGSVISAFLVGFSVSVYGKIFDRVKRSRRV